MSTGSSLAHPSATRPGYRHPHVVVQNNLFNRSLIRTLLVCPLTSNLKRANAPGNVLLQRGEAGLHKASVVDVSQVFTVDRSQLEERIGALSIQRVQQVVEGINLFIVPREVD